jgi:steroid delta-isomerase-like uncharacterized protein
VLPVSQEANKAVVRRFYEELWNQWKLDVADEILASDLRFRGTLVASGTGIGAFSEYFEQTPIAFPDLHAVIDELIAADDAVVAGLTWSATHAGDLTGIPAIGRRWSYVGAGIFYLDGGRIQDAWIVGDAQELWRAASAIPSSRPALT